MKPVAIPVFAEEIRKVLEKNRREK